MLRCVGLDLRAVQRIHVPQLHQPRLLAQRQYLYEQARQRIQIVLAKVGEVVRKSGVLFAANTLRGAMSSWRRWAMRREDATPTQ